MNVVTENSDTSDSKAPKITISWIYLVIGIGLLVVDSYLIRPTYSQEHKTDYFQDLLLLIGYNRTFRSMSAFNLMSVLCPYCAPRFHLKFELFVTGLSFFWQSGPLIATAYAGSHSS